jgi:hypothetical protein
MTVYQSHLCLTFGELTITDETRGYDDAASRSPVRGGGDSRARSASPDGRDRVDTR